MKQFRIMLAGAIAIAMATCVFTACSNEDATPQTPPVSVDNFYMQIQLTGNAPTAGAKTRTSGDPTEEGEAQENTITNGTLWLLDDANNVAFTRNITTSDFQTATGKEKTTKPLKVSVNSVKEGTTYHVYFMANSNLEVGTSPVDPRAVFNSVTGGADDAKANLFVMVNQNDKQVKANQYTVVFTKANKEEANPAKPANAIKLDRITARLDAPTAAATTIKPNPNSKEPSATDNIEVVTKMTLLGYALKNVATREYVIQSWNTDFSLLKTPSLDKYFQAQDEFGSKVKAENLNLFTKKRSYLFENYSAVDNENATGIYMQFKADVKTDGAQDFTDGTFYRYDKKIYTSLEDIVKALPSSNPFGKKDLAEVKKSIADEADPTKVTENQDSLAKFRTDYNIQVFAKGEVFYEYTIQTANPAHDGYAVLRNCLYRINVENIFDLGADVPNGEDDKKPNYYLQVSVTVNPWILNTINIDLK